MAQPWESYLGPAGVPTDCSVYSNPTSDAVDCAVEYEAHESEICDIWVVPAALTAGQWAAANLPVNWEYKGDLNATTGVAHFEVVGDKPLSEVREASLPKFRTIAVERTHNMTIDILHASLVNYDFVRFYQTPGIHAAIWYADYGGYIYGGANGIIAWVPNAGNIHGRGQGTLLANQILFQWRNMYDPPAATLNAGSSAQMAGPAPLIATVPMHVQGLEPIKIKRGRVPTDTDKGKGKAPKDQPSKS